MKSKIDFDFWDGVILTCLGVSAILLIIGFIHLLDR